MEIEDKYGEKRMVPKPETLESVLFVPCSVFVLTSLGRYGIGSFVYTSRRPFHPKRLWDLMAAPFCILQNGAEEEEEDDDEDGEEAQEDETCELVTEEDEEKAKQETFEQLQREKAEMDLPLRAKNKRESPVWKGLLRSKGFIWLATRPNVHGEWSQAGVSPWRGDRGEKAEADVGLDHVHSERRRSMDVQSARERVARRWQS
jgi:G3E family GTPase